jgi:murein DD-endopeptidase MepM/ murein hydrolase activator NlpD
LLSPWPVQISWKVFTLRRTIGSGYGKKASGLVGVPAALALLLALSPVGPLPVRNMALGPTHSHVARAEAALPIVTTGGRSQAVSGSASAGLGTDQGGGEGQSERSSPGVSVASSATVAIERSPATTLGRSATPTPPPVTVFGVVSTASVRPVAATATPTPTASATASPTPTASPTATPTATPNPFAGDTLTDVSKVPGWQNIDWPAYVPAAAATPVPGVKGTGQFIMPVSGFISTQYSAAHLAVDIAGPTGSPVLAADTGTVVFAGLDYGGLGYAVEIDHGNGYISAYGHNSALKVQAGQIVRRGDVIALRGSTGHSTGPHVHFAIHKDGQAVDPFNLLIGGDPPAPVPQVLVPNLVGGTEANAVAALKGLTLVLTVDPPQPSADVPAGKLATQGPAAGSLADIDSPVHVALSSGTPTPSPTVTPEGTPTLSARATADGTPEGTPEGTPAAPVTATAAGTPNAVLTVPAAVAPSASPAASPSTPVAGAAKASASMTQPVVTSSPVAPPATSVPAAATTTAGPPATASPRPSTANIVAAPTTTTVATTPTPRVPLPAHVPATPTAAGHTASR